MKTLTLARRIATLELLFNKAIAAGVVGESLAKLSHCRHESLKALEECGLSGHEQSQLLNLFRNTVQAGAETISTTSSVGPGVTGLLFDVGIHAESFEGYLKVVHSVFQDGMENSIQRWLPRGDHFKEIERQRKRWGHISLALSSQRCK